MKSFSKIAVLCLLVMLCAQCGSYFSQPLDVQPARIGEETAAYNRLINMPPAAQKAVVGVYKFEDQTGQFKQAENGSTFSNAVTQGGTTILIKALEDSNWFRIIERENYINLQNERNIIRSTRQDYAKQNNTVASTLDPLLYAGVLIEGGIVSYDTNVLTGGAGARYFGAGGSSKYRQDRVTVYLRVISVRTGEILKTVYVSKTIFSQAVDASLFRYVSFQRLLEAETGFTRNEPGQLAIKEAIEKGVEALIIEGIEAQIWAPQGGPQVAQKLIMDYRAEKEEAQQTDVYQRDLQQYRSKWSLFGLAGATRNYADLPNADYEYNLSAGMRYNLTSHLGIEGSVHKFRLNNRDILNREFAATELNLSYMLLPYDKFSPLLYAGAGVNHANWFEVNDLKVQAGLGFEYMVTPSVGIRAMVDYNVAFSDELDGIVSGTRDDHYLKGGLGISIHLGTNDAKKKDVKKQLRIANRKERKLKKKLKKAQPNPVANDSVAPQVQVKLF